MTPDAGEAARVRGVPDSNACALELRYRNEDVQVIADAMRQALPVPGNDVPDATPIQLLEQRPDEAFLETFDRLVRAYMGLATAECIPSRILAYRVRRSFPRASKPL